MDILVFKEQCKKECTNGKDKWECINCLLDKINQHYMKNINNIVDNILSSKNQITNYKDILENIFSKNQYFIDRFGEDMIERDIEILINIKEYGIKYTHEKYNTTNICKLSILLALLCFFLEEDDILDIDNIRGIIGDYMVKYNRHLHR